MGTSSSDPSVSPLSGSFDPFSQALGAVTGMAAGGPSSAFSTGEFGDVYVGGLTVPPLDNGLQIGQNAIIAIAIVGTVAMWAALRKKK